MSTTTGTNGGIFAEPNYTPQQRADELRAGFVAAKRGEPYQCHTSAPWQAGWLQQRSAALAKSAGSNDHTEITSLLTILRHACLRLASKGELATDLATALALRALSGTGDDDLFQIEVEPFDTGFEDEDAAAVHPAGTTPAPPAPRLTENARDRGLHVVARSEAQLSNVHPLTAERSPE